MLEGFGYPFAGQAVERPGHQEVEFPAGGRGEHPLKLFAVGMLTADVVDVLGTMVQFCLAANSRKWANWFSVS